MESASNLLIVVDAGHGGWDSGAQSGVRREKDDNLRLALETQKKLSNQGLQVMMTRSDDIFVSPAKRAELANQNDADLFISLHRNSIPQPREDASGVENFIYLTSPLETSGRAAQLVLSEISDVGVQQMIGVSRGNYGVLRRAAMPAMLLEMGFINNEGDNRLFDQNLASYAGAIARGVVAYFGLLPGSAPPDGDRTPSPAIREENDAVMMQKLLEQRYGFNLTPTGRYDEPTRRAVSLALQLELASAFNAKIKVDGVVGPDTLKAIPPVSIGSSGGLVALLQVLLVFKGYPRLSVDGVFGQRTATALRIFQRDNYLVADGTAGHETWLKLLRQ